MVPDDDPRPFVGGLCPDPTRCAYIKRKASGPWTCANKHPRVGEQSPPERWGSAPTRGGEIVIEAKPVRRAELAPMAHDVNRGERR